MNHKTESFNAKIMCLMRLRVAEDVLFRQVCFMGRHKWRWLEDGGSACSLERGGAVHEVGTVNTVPVEQIMEMFV
jgi:hypothetical protein